MSIIKNGSLTQIQQIHAAVKAVTSLKRAATDEACHIARQKKVEREVVGRSIKLPRGRPKKGTTPSPQYGAAAKRKKLYLSSAGLRTFHMGWSSVSKSSIPHGPPGTRVYANAAALHVVYIEDGAIVRMGHTVYIDSSRVETRPDGERLVLENISKVYEQRVEFFRLVDQFERVNHGDKVEIDFEVNAHNWQAVVEDPNCDPAVVTAYAEWAANIERLKKQPIALEGSGPNLRMLMKDHGFVFANPIVNDERLKRDGFCFRDGRGGRTEYRLVFELPREFEYEQRAKALKRLCQQFEEAGCMYVAVIHAPDPHNDQDNYHVHLDFYDRKCRRLDGTPDDLMNVKKQFKSLVEDEMALGKYREQARARAWDFTVKRTYTSNKCTKTHYPFGATHKSAAVRDIRFVAKVRKAFAADINAIAREAGYGDLYDPRSYAAMGLNCPASKKLGPAAHGLETKGVPTKIGLDNEAAQAKFEMQLIERAHQDRGRQLDAIQFDWQKASDDSSVEMTAHKLAGDEELARARMATDILRDLALLQLERERERSRATLVNERQGRASQSGTPAGQMRSASLVESADAYLAALDQKDLGLIADIAALEEFVAAHEPERAARLISKFQQAKLRLELERDLGRLLPGQLGESGKRNIMMRRGTLADVGYQPREPIALPGIAVTPAAKPSLVVEIDKSLADASPITERTGQSDATATPITASDSSSSARDPLEVDNLALAVRLLKAQQHRDQATQAPATPATTSDPEAPSGKRQDKPSLGDESLANDDERDQPSKAKEQSLISDHPGPAQEQCAAQKAVHFVDHLTESETRSQTAPADQISPTPLGREDDSMNVGISSDKRGSANATVVDREPLGREHEEKLVAVEQSRTSFGKENHDPAAPTGDGNARSVAAEHDTLTTAQTTNFVGAMADNAATRDTPDEPSTDDAGRVEAPSVDRSGDAVADQPPRGAPVAPTEEERREILRPRRLGHDGVFRAVDLPTDTPKSIPAIVARQQDLDPITLAKLLWAYDGIRARAKAALPDDDKQLYSSATKDPLVDKLRTALSKGRQNQREAFHAAELARQIGQAKTAAAALHVGGSRYDDQHTQAAWQAQHQKGRV